MGGGQAAAAGSPDGGGGWEDGIKWRPAGRRRKSRSRTRVEHESEGAGRLPPLAGSSQRKPLAMLRQRPAGLDAADAGGMLERHARLCAHARVQRVAPSFCPFDHECCPFVVWWGPARACASAIGTAQSPPKQMYAPPLARHTTRTVTTGASLHRISRTAGGTAEKVVQ